jgi:Yip1-like protein
MAADVQEAVKSAPAGLPARVIGILTSPRQTYEGVVARPRWFGMMAVVLLTSVVLLFIFLSTPVGQQAMLDQQVKQAELRGVEMSDAMYRRTEAMLPMFRFIIPGSILVVGPIMTFLIAGILYGVFNVAMGGDAIYKQVLAVVTHAGAVQIVQQLFTIPFNYFRESMSSPTTLAVFAPMLDERGFVARVLGMIDLFFLWWIFVLAVGLAVLYKKRTQPIAISLIATYLVIILAIAGVMSLL